MTIEMIEPADDREPDAEVVPVDAVHYGGPVDPPDERRTLYGTILSSKDHKRQRIVPAWLRNHDQRVEFAKAWADQQWYTARWHAWKAPKYTAKVVFWAIVGVFRLAGRQIAWWWDRNSFHVEQAAIQDNDRMGFHRARREGNSRKLFRGILLGGELVALTVVVLLLRYLAPLWLQLVAVLTAMPPIAWMGRPVDRPIIDRVTTGPRFVKLTAEMVRTSLCSLGMPAIKEPGQVSFPPPGIHRDGPGWLARVNLPQGVEAVDVLERRGKLSSALRLPVDQVWPTAGPEHAGQLDLWVGYLPASRMGQPTWSLAKPHARTSYFEMEEFGTDERQRPVRTQLFAQNFLIGGRPGSGKSFAGRTIVTIGALDPTVEIKVAEYKGTGDFLDLEPLCSTYVCGLADEDFAMGLGILQWGLAEAERRGKRIKDAYARGEAPDRKVTPQLAAKRGSGLHPILIVIDEAHELFGDPEVGKEAAIAAERLAKRGRALAITLVILTQIPDKDSLPTGITRNIGIRWCLAVPDQVANDMILGTGAYKRGITGTVYRPTLDAGWGVLTGLADPTAVRSHYPDPDTTRAIVERAKALRGGVVAGADEDMPTRRDVLADVLRVFATLGRVGIHWSTLAEQLAELMPEAYEDITPEEVSELVRARGVAPEQVKVAGVNLWGVKRVAVEQAVSKRELEA